MKNIKENIKDKTESSSLERIKEEKKINNIIKII